MKIIAVILIATVAVQARSPGSVVPLQNESSGRIVGGTEATRGQFPHQAFIIADGANFCGGALISSEWVLTAGHCVENMAAWDVILGQQNRIDDEPGRIRVRTTTAVLHPNYNHVALANDIALLKISPVEFTEFIDVAPLPTRTDASNAFVGTAVTASGWGKSADGVNPVTDQLNYVNLNTISNADCIAKYGYVVGSGTICCAGTSGAGTCNGDSGGPLILADGSDKLIGLASFVSSNGCSSGSPSGYVRVSTYLNWIEETTGITIEP